MKVSMLRLQSTPRIQFLARKTTFFFITTYLTVMANVESPIDSSDCSSAHSRSSSQDDLKTKSHGISFFLLLLLLRLLPRCLSVEMRVRMNCYCYFHASNNITIIINHVHQSAISEIGCRSTLTYFMRIRYETSLTWRAMIASEAKKRFGGGVSSLSRCWRFVACANVEGMMDFCISCIFPLEFFSIMFDLFRCVLVFFFSVLIWRAIAFLLYARHTPWHRCTPMVITIEICVTERRWILNRYSWQWHRPRNRNFSFSMLYWFDDQNRLLML